MLTLEDEQALRGIVEVMAQRMEQEMRTSHDKQGKHTGTHEPKKQAEQPCKLDGEDSWSQSGPHLEPRKMTFTTCWLLLQLVNDFCNWLVLFLFGSS